MYEKHFGLTRRPFASTADAPSRYPAAGQQRAFEQIVAGLEGHEGILLLTGEPGTGKTLLTHRLLDHFRDTRSILWITNAHLPHVTAFYQALLYDLGRPFLQRPEQEMRLELTEMLLEAFRSEKPGLLVLDEAQHLGIPVLEEIRLLGNLEAGEGRVMQVVLAGQPTLLLLLKRPELTSLRQRICVRARLEPLEPEESKAYVNHLLQAAGGRPERLITGEALELLVSAARGVSRLLNQAAHLALQVAFSARQSQVDAEAMLAALEALGLMGDGTQAQEATRERANAHWTEEGTELDRPREADRPRRLFGPARRSA